ncbi:MAG: tetratricopeptide repeat protein [Turneriella sp.]|nr:tetratricopeptide repeat protein [Leptospiraceae bacterium]MCX7632650.1 tetratricopeptide repeat protein [Turneriella sp.]
MRAFLGGLALALLLVACRARALAEEGIRRMEEGKHTTALDLFDRALRSNPTEPLALYGKGILLAQEPITQEIALSMLRQAVEQAKLPPKYHTEALLRAAEIFAARNKKDEALQQLARIPSEARLADGNVVGRLVSLYLQLKEITRARELLVAYLETHRDDWAREYLLFRLYLTHLKEPKAAGRFCRKELWPDQVPAKYILNCARLSVALGEYAAAEQLLAQYGKRSAVNEDEVRSLRDAIARKRGKWDFSESDF